MYFANMVSKNAGKLVLHGVLIAILLFGLVRILIGGGPNFLRLELAGMLFLLFLSLLGFIQYHSKWGELILSLVFVFYIFNLLLIWLRYQSLYVTLLILALVGFYLAIFSSYKPTSLPSNPEAHNMILDNPAMKVAEETSKENVATSFIPGKLVASKQSNQFHEPKCEWAKKIRKERRLWFSSKQEAWEKGYRSHSCVQ